MNPTTTSLKRNIDLLEAESLVMQRKKRIVMSSPSASSTDDSQCPRSTIAVEDLKMMRGSSTSTMIDGIARTQGIRSESKVQRSMSGRARYVNPYEQQQYGDHRYHYLPNGPARRSKYDVLPKPPPSSISSREECSALTTTSSKVLSVNSKSKVTFNLHPSSSSSPTVSTGPPPPAANANASATSDSALTTAEAEAGQVAKTNPDSGPRQSPVMDKINAGVSLSPSLTRPSSLLSAKEVAPPANEEKGIDGVPPTEGEGEGNDDDDEDRHFGVLGSRERETREFERFWRDRFRDVLWMKMGRC
ncbi:hypothetical protein L218DRAFT_1007085 [Marasmius fiardii PR-910]|nr:hypothetical protein L218DRAFT_1007085 [Marasmius fiardii PR-910]